MKEIRNAYKVLVRNLEGNISSWRPRSRWNYDTPGVLRMTWRADECFETDANSKYLGRAVTNQNYFIPLAIPYLLALVRGSEAKIKSSDNSCCALPTQRTQTQSDTRKDGMNTPCITPPVPDAVGNRSWLFSNRRNPENENVCSLIACLSSQQWSITCRITLSDVSPRQYCKNHKNVFTGNRTENKWEFILTKFWVLLNMNFKLYVSK
jgi:hypothetical protein